MVGVMVALGCVAAEGEGWVEEGQALAEGVRSYSWLKHCCVWGRMVN